MLSNSLPSTILQPGVCTSASRPTQPYEGMVIYETDTGRILLRRATEWWIVEEPWQAFTPSVLQPTAVTATVNVGKYKRSYGKVRVDVHLTVTGTGTAANSVAVTLPVAQSPLYFNHSGGGMIWDNSTTTRYVLSCEMNNAANNVQFAADQVGSGLWGVTPAIALTVADQIRFAIDYEYDPND